MVFDADDELGPLHAAARDGNLAGVREALRRFGAGTRDVWGQTALHWAGSDEVAKTLVAAGGNPSERDPTGDTPLHWATEHGNTKVAEFLLAQPTVNVNAANHRGDTPLHAAAASRNFETVRCIIDASADPKVVNKAGETAIHVAARTGEVNVVKALVKAGGKVKVAAGNGSTPLHEACRVHTSVQLIKYLIQRNADVNAVTNSGRAVLQDAVKRKAHPIIEELCDKGAEVTCLARDAALRGHGWTALHLAAESGSLKLCQAVVKKGAAFYDAEAATSAGLRPVDVARQSTYASDKVVKYLEEQVKLKKLAHGTNSSREGSPTRGAIRHARANASPAPAPDTRSRRGSVHSQSPSSALPRQGSRRGSTSSSRAASPGSSRGPSRQPSRRGSIAGSPEPSPQPRSSSPRNLAPSPPLSESGSPKSPDSPPVDAPSAAASPPVGSPDNASPADSLVNSPAPPASDSRSASPQPDTSP